MLFSYKNDHRESHEHFFHEKKFNFIIRALGGRYMSLSGTHTFQHVKKKGKLKVVIYGPRVYGIKDFFSILLVSFFCKCYILSHYYFYDPQNNNE